jgi:hypothetical protein
VLAYQQREQRFLVGVLVFGVTQNVLRLYLVALNPCICALSFFGSLNP